MTKRIVSFSLILLIVFSCLPGVFASSDKAQASADALYSLGLFKGTGVDSSGRPVYELDRAPTRQEAVVMLIRLLGREDEALSGAWSHPFSDVESWADKYVGFAYAMGLTNGISSKTFGSADKVSALQFLTFTLRALGYNDSAGDFNWDKAGAFSRKIGLTSGEYQDAGGFLRGDIAIISFGALSQTMKGTGTTLIQSLVNAAVVTESSAKRAGLSGSLKPMNTQSLSAEQIYSRCSPAVFYIAVYDKNKKFLGSGSGFFISGAGVAVTNYHVVINAYYAKILLSDGETVLDVDGVYDYSVENDLALLKIDGGPFPFLETGNSAELSTGATVYTIGSPLGLDNTISQGLISNADRVIDGQSFIQISAPISPGSSGGALIDEFGRVIGVTTAGFENAQNLNLAVPINLVKELLTGSVLTLNGVALGAAAAASVKQEASLDTIDPAQVALSASENLLSLSVNNQTLVEFRHNLGVTVHLDCVNSSPSALNVAWNHWSDVNTILLSVTAVSVGTATITVSIREYPNAKQVVKVVVSPPFSRLVTSADAPGLPE